MRTDSVVEPAPEPVEPQIPDLKTTAEHLVYGCPSAQISRLHRQTCSSQRYSRADPATVIKVRSTAGPAAEVRTRCTAESALAFHRG
jgi:hypothetical protein